MKLMRWPRTWHIHPVCLSNMPRFLTTYATSRAPVVGACLWARPPLDCSSRGIQVVLVPSARGNSKLKKTHSPAAGSVQTLHVDPIYFCSRTVDGND